MSKKLFPLALALVLFAALGATAWSTSPAAETQGTCTEECCKDCPNCDCPNCDDCDSGCKDCPCCND